MSILVTIYLLGMLFLPGSSYLADYFRNGYPLARQDVTF
jgi:hypothetical protein